MARTPRKIVWQITDVGRDRVDLTRDRRPVANDIHPDLARQMIRAKITPADQVIHVETDGYHYDVTREFFRAAPGTTRKN